MSTSHYDLDADGYRDWLTSGRPPFEWFASLSKLEQSALAEIGAEHAAEVIAAIGDAIRGIASPEDDAAAAAQLAGRVLDGMFKGRAEPVAGHRAASEPSMAGTISRRHAASEARREAKAEALSFLGRRPSEVPE